MKKHIIILVLGIFLFSCEDVIDVDVSSEEPRLIIDALIRVDPNEEFTKVVVKARQTNSFFESTTVAELKQITFTNLDFPRNSIDPDVLVEDPPGSGIYTKTFETDFLTAGQLLLQVEYKDQIYIARTYYVSTNNFNSIEQGDGNLFDNETEVIVSFTDIPDEDNFYLFDFDFGEYLVTEDTFYKGQNFTFSYFYDDQLKSGQELSLSILGVDDAFYNYMNQLIQQTDDNLGPFAPPVSTVRGNLINATAIGNPDNPDNVKNPDNFLLGYFAVCQEYKQTFIVE